MSTAAECPAPSRAEPCHAGYQGQDLAPSPPRLSKAAGDVLGRHLWGRGYFVCSSGNVTDEVIAEYIRVQGGEPQNDDHFPVSEE
jgi:REP element-mobilizing transposase RayT